MKKLIFIDTGLVGFIPAHTISVKEIVSPDFTMWFYFSASGICKSLKFNTVK